MKRPMKAETSLTSTATARLLPRRSVQQVHPQVETLTVIAGVRRDAGGVREAGAAEVAAAHAK
jgi:hypothetical protein